MTMSERILIMVKNKVVLKERELLVNTAYDDLSERIERAYEKIYELKVE